MVVRKAGKSKGVGFGLLKKNGNRARHGGRMIRERLIQTTTEEQSDEPSSAAASFKHKAASLRRTWCALLVSFQKSKFFFEQTNVCVAPDFLLCVSVW